MSSSYLQYSGCKIPLIYLQSLILFRSSPPAKTNFASPNLFNSKNPHKLNGLRKIIQPQQRFYIVHLCWTMASGDDGGDRKGIMGFMWELSEKRHFLGFYNRYGD
jgi:hypothetical protein